MAITKQATNVSVEVKKDYNLTVGKKLEKIADRMNVEAKSKNLELASVKKIQSQGNKHQGGKS